MVDIQLATGEIRRGKKEEEETRNDGRKSNVRICYTHGGHKKKEESNHSCKI